MWFSYLRSFSGRLFFADDLSASLAHGSLAAR